MFAVQTKVAVQTPEWTDCSKEAICFNNTKDSHAHVGPGAESVVAGMPHEKQRCDFDGKKWAWVKVHNVTIKVTESSAAAGLLALDWTTKTCSSSLVAIKGTPIFLNAGKTEITINNPRIMKCFVVCSDVEAPVESADAPEGLEID